MGLIAFALVAVAAVLLILNTVNRASEISFTEFKEYVANTQFYKDGDDGKKVPNEITVTDGEGEHKIIVSIIDPEIKLDDDYFVNDKGAIVKKVKNSKGAEVEVPLIVIWKIKL